MTALNVSLRQAPAQADDDEADVRHPGAGVAPAAVPRRRFRTGSLIAALLLLATLVPAVLWLQHQSAFVVSRNALVRAHLSDLGTRVEGVVREIRVDAGSRVKAGDVLVQLDDRQFRAELARATAEQKELAASYGAEGAAIELERARLRLHIRGAEAEVRRATAALQAALSEAEDAAAFHRAREALLPERAISREVVRDAAAKASTASARAAANLAEQEAAINSLAEAHHSSRELAVREQRLTVLAARSEQAAALVDGARANLEATTIRAPADGAIIRPLAQPGMVIDVGTPALSMWFSNDTWIEAWVSESDLSDIAVGNKVQVTSPALPGEVLEGVVSTVGLATDFEMPLDYLPRSRSERLQQSPLVGVAIRLDAMPDVLRPGMSAVANIERSGT